MTFMLSVTHDAQGAMRARPRLAQNLGLFLLCVMALLTGCATGPNANPRDPLEPLNREVFKFNDVVDKAVLKPVATAYRDVTPVPVRKAEPAHGLRVGMQVFHNKFGEGALLALEGAGDDARAQVKFGRHGVKWLALSVAKLTPVP